MRPLPLISLLSALLLAQLSHIADAQVSSCIVTSTTHLPAEDPPESGGSHQHEPGLVLEFPTEAQTGSWQACASVLVDLEYPEEEGHDHSRKLAQHDHGGDHFLRLRSHRSFGIANMGVSNNASFCDNSDTRRQLQSYIGTVMEPAEFIEEANPEAHIISVINCCTEDNCNSKDDVNLQLQVSKEAPDGHVLFQKEDAHNGSESAAPMGLPAALLLGAVAAMFNRMLA